MTSLSKTYYVSSKTGNDSNDGLTEENAFASLFAINHISLQPGDKVLLERGCVFYGQYLQVTDSGSKDAPIVIGAYGDGNAPRIEACGQGAIDLQEADHATWFLALQNYIRLNYGVDIDPACKNVSPYRQVRKKPPYYRRLLIYIIRCFTSRQSCNHPGSLR